MFGGYSNEEISLIFTYINFGTAHNGKGGYHPEAG
jgi:hypothetical protein